MSETSVEGGVQGQFGSSEGSPGPNPAWNDVLSTLPEQFHNVVTPHFQKWDQEAQSKIEAANTQLKEFEDYKAFVEHGITPNEIEQGLRLMFEINNNPRNVYDALSKAYEFNPATGEYEESEDDDDEAEYDDPRFSELQQGINLVSQIVLAEQQAKSDSQADAELDRELKGLKDKFGEYDEDYVLAKMQNGMSGEAAVNSFMQLRGQFLQGRPYAPNILGGSAGGGAGLPSNAIDPTKLSGKDTRNLVAQMLAAEYGQRT